MCPSSTSSSDRWALLPEPERRSWLAVTGGLLFLLICAICGYIETFHLRDEVEGLSQKGPELEAFEAEARALTKIWNGQRARFHETRQVLRSRLRRPVRRYWSAAMLGLLGQMQNSVPGKDGYHFLPNRLVHAPGRHDRRPAMVAARISALDRRLRLARTRLVITPVPEKGAVVPEARPWRFPPLPDGNGLLLSALRERHVDVVDLRAAWATRALAAPYMRTDSHWSPAGARAAAEAIAEAAGVWVPEPERRSTVREVLPSGALAPYDAGDLTQIAGISAAGIQESWWPERWLTAMGRIRVGRVWKVLPRPEAGAAPPPVIVHVGSSYTNAYDFEDYLQHYSGNRCVVLPKPGWTPSMVMRAGLDHVFAQHKTVMSWELPLYQVYGDYDLLEALPVYTANLRAKDLAPLAPLLPGAQAAVGILPGEHSLPPGAPAVMVPVPLAVSGGGEVAVRLATEVSGGLVTLVTEVGEDRTEISLPAGSHLMGIPVIGGRGGAQFRIGARSAEGATLRIVSAEVVSDLAVGEAVPLELGPQGRVTVAGGGAPPPHARGALVVAPAAGVGELRWRATASAPLRRQIVGAAGAVIPCGAMPAEVRAEAGTIQAWWVPPLPALRRDP